MTEEKKKPEYEITTFHSKTNLKEETINRLTVKASDKEEVKELYLFAKKENSK